MAAPTNAPHGLAGQAPTAMSTAIAYIPRLIMLYAAITAFDAFTGSTRKQRSGARPAVSRAGGAVAASRPLTNGFAGVPLELRVYLSEREAFAAFDDEPVWREQFALSYSGSGPVARLNHTHRASRALMRNETSLWAHIYLTRSGASPDPRSAQHSPALTAERHHCLVAYKRAPARRRERSLISGAAGGGAAEAEARAPEAGELSHDREPERPLVPHWIPSLSIAVSSELSIYARRSSVPEVLLEHLALPAAAGGAGPAGHTALGSGLPAQGTPEGAPSLYYLPRPWVNDVWLPESAVQPLNGSTPLLRLELELCVVSLVKLTLLSQLSKSLQQQARMHADSAGGAAASEELRRMLTETNPYLLLLTFAVTLLHSLFDFLAFRNDIKFWRGTKSMEGLSTRSLLSSVVVSAITFLYLLDNDTSNVILMSTGVGLAIELWKAHKVCAVSLAWRGTRLPRLAFTARGGFAHTATATYDAQAAEYVAWALLPLVAGTSAYSVCYSAHKSWYSWLLSSLVSAVYSFGFAQQAPQLFINYKLKSTAHMPWKTLCYKALNTFIDDLFAFIIKMPTMHRLACLRDDVIFVIYMYQRYAYGVDAKRANEYGQREADEAEPAAGGARPLLASGSAARGRGGPSGAAAAVGASTVAAES